MTNEGTRAKRGGGLRRRLMKVGAVVGLVLLARKLRARRAAKTGDSEIENLSVTAAK